MTKKQMQVDNRVPWKEYPDPTPVEVPLHFRRPPTLQEQIKAMVRGELSRHAADQGMESFEEADDFDVGDVDELPFSRHELTPMQEDFSLPDASQAELEAPQGTPPKAPPANVAPEAAQPDVEASPKS